MGWIIKLEADKLIYEVGKKNVQSIRLHREEGLVEIEFKKNSKWDAKIISIHKVGSILFNEEQPNIDPTITEDFTSNITKKMDANVNNL